MSSVLASDGATVKFSIARDKLQIEYSCPGSDWERTVFFALQTRTEAGLCGRSVQRSLRRLNRFSALSGEPNLPPVRWVENSFSIFKRTWENWKWSDYREARKELDLQVGVDDCLIRLPLSALVRS